MMAADPADVSVLHMAFYLSSGGGTRYLNAFEGGAQQDRVDGGAHQICEQLAARLGDRVRLGEPVRAIHQDRQRSRGAHRFRASFTATRWWWRCRRCWPTRSTSRRACRCGAPASSRRAGCAVKVHLVYPGPLWRAHGLSGWSVSSQGPLLSTVDDSPADGSVGVLTGFVTGTRGTPLLRADYPDPARGRRWPRRRSYFPTCRRRSAST